MAIPTDSYKESGKPDKSGSAYSTNLNQYDKAKNIYDLAGNLTEWTMQAYSSYIRIYRGGYFGNSDNNASFRNYYYPFDVGGEDRFKSYTLYKVAPNTVRIKNKIQT